MNGIAISVFSQFFLLLLSTVTPCFAHMGTAAAPPGPSVTPTIFGPPGLDQYWMQQLNTAFKDAITIARTVVATFDSCDPSYLRYFRKEDALFVRSVFRTIANYETANLNKDLTSTDIPSILASTDLNDDFSKLSIYFGSHPRSQDINCVSPNQMASMFEFDDGRAAISICPAPFNFPSLADAYNPPKRVRDPDGTPFIGYGCDRLGERESDFLWCPGIVMLHEMIHWTHLLNRIPDYNSLINIKPGPNTRGIIDFQAPIPNPGETQLEPQSGYGQFNSRRLKELSMFSPNYPPHVTLNNVDNYVSYAILRYWSWRCGREFKEALTERDTWKRIPAPFPAPSGVTPVVAPPQPPPAPSL